MSFTALRTASETARRALALYAVIAASHGEDRAALSEWLKAEGLWEAVTPEERLLLSENTPTPQQMINASWRAEALLPLLWSLNLLPELLPPESLCDPQALRSVLPPLLGSTDAWVRSAQLRPVEEIEDANDEIYEIHWAVRDAQISGRPAPKESDPGIVQERHHALNWMVRYEDQEWDDVATDT